MHYATVRAFWYGNSNTEPAGITAEPPNTVGLAAWTGIGGVEVELGTTNIRPPSSIGSTYSYVAQLALEVTAIADPVTTIHDLQLVVTPNCPQGVRLFVRTALAYVDERHTARSVLGLDDVATEATHDEDPTRPDDPTTPAGWTKLPEITYIPVTSLGFTPTALNGGMLGIVQGSFRFIQLMIGVSSHFIGPARTVTLPLLLMQYTEGTD